jgi:hypothetical protein
MDYVYTCRSGDNEELRYSIRSVVKNLPEGRIWLVGGKPEWYVGDYIAVQNEKNKFYSINKCWDAIRNSLDISKDFVLMNDDFYIINKINSIETMHGGLLSEKIQRYSDQHGVNKYSQILFRANRQLQYMGIKEPLDYDIHVPMPINKNNITDKVLSGLAPRSLYGNLNNVGGVLINDVKVYSNSDNINYSFKYKQEETNFISSVDGSFKEMYETILKDMFNTKTHYEK